MTKQSCKTWNRMPLMTRLQTAMMAMTWRAKILRKTRMSTVQAAIAIVNHWLVFRTAAAEVGVLHELCCRPSNVGHWKKSFLKISATSSVSWSKMTLKTSLLFRPLHSSLRKFNYARKKEIILSECSVIRNYTVVMQCCSVCFLEVL